MEITKCKVCDGRRVSIVRVNKYKIKNGKRVKKGTSSLDYRCADCARIISKIKSVSRPKPRFRHSHR